VRDALLEQVRSEVAATFIAPAKIAFRSIWFPTRGECVSSARESIRDPDRLLEEMFGITPPEAARDFVREPSVHFPANWGVDPAKQRFLDGFVRLAMPGRFLETGVADGVSSRTILEAMEANGKGSLVSVDISPAAGAIARQSPAAKRWEFYSLPARGRDRTIRQIINHYRPLDVFMHDSDHRYVWEMLEYREGWKAIRPGGWLLSDDIDSSYAFIDFSREVGIRPWILSSSDSLFGAIRKPG
jgi:predicted O-methyltransferase YrrM